MKRQPVLPRILRAGVAPGYLGMSKDEFRKTVRPFVSEFPIGTQGVGFDRYELDEWADSYISAHAVNKEARTGCMPVRIGKRQLEAQEVEKSGQAFRDALITVGRADLARKIQ